MSKPRAFASVTNAFALFASTARDASVLASSRAWARARSQPPFHALATTPTRAAYATSARAVDAIHRTMDDERRRRLGLPKRTGVVAIKAGMTCEWDARGARVPLTVLWLDDVVVVKTLSSDGDDGYDAVQIGYGSRKPKQVSKGELGHYKRHGSNIKRGLCEFA
jgi:Ribosomal protein L3